MIIKTVGQTTYKLILNDDLGIKANEYKWYCKKNRPYYYFYTYSNKQLYSLKQLVLGLEKHTILLHKNDNPFDFRRENLIIMTRKEFSAAFVSSSMNGRSSYHNVQWSSTVQKWHVLITNDKTVIVDRYFLLENEAAIVADYIQFTTHGRLLVPNFPYMKPDDLKYNFDNIVRRYGSSKSEIKSIYQQGSKNTKATHLSKFIGVSYDKRRSKFYARIKYAKKNYWLGYHTSEEAAAKAYNLKALELYGNSAKLNEL